MTGVVKRERRGEKIVGARLSRVSVPLDRPYISAGNRAGAREIARTIVQLETSSGLVGIGEAAGAPEVFRITEQICKTLVGQNALEISRLRLSFASKAWSNRNGRNGWIALGGVESACWDIIGKRYDAPLWELLGGKLRDRVELAGLMGAIPLERPPGVEELDAFVREPANLERVVAQARDLVDRYGFRALKIKSAALYRPWDVGVMRRLRETFGPDMNLRLDANGAWPVTQALALGAELEPLRLEYLEDPTNGIEGMARLRRDVRIPFATNMCITNFDQLPVGLRMNAADVILGDVYEWGGIAGFRELESVCKAFGVDVGIHSGIELGVGTALNLHLAASSLVVNHAIDGVLHSVADDLLTEPLAIADGELPVPDGPGIGVALDDERLARYRLEHVVVSGEGS